MKTTRILGAVVLAMTMVLLSADLSQALEENVQPVDLWGINEIVATTEGVSGTVVSEGRSLADLVEEAKLARDYVVAHPPTMYLGLESYIDKLIGFAEAGVVKNEAELKRALEEVIAAVPLLTAQEEVSQESVDEQPVRSRRMEDSVVPVVATTLEVKVEQNQADDVSDVNASSELMEEASEVSLEEVEDMEVPKTGETRQIGLGGLMIAGAAVVVGTIGAALLIVKNRKNW